VTPLEADNISKVGRQTIGLARHDRYPSLGLYPVDAGSISFKSDYASPSIPTPRVSKRKMAAYDLIVLNGLVVTDQDTGELDIAVKDGKIAKIVSRGGFVGIEAKKFIDAKGGMVMVSRSLTSLGTSC
jgi:hypothetical protein